MNLSHSFARRLWLALLLSIVLSPSMGDFFASVALVSGAKVGMSVYAQDKDAQDTDVQDEEPTVGTTLSLGEYRVQLDESVAILDEAGVQGGADAALLALENVCDLLAGTEAVELESGRTIRLVPPFHGIENADSGGVSGRVNVLPHLDAVVGRLRLIRNQIDAASQDDATARLAVLDEIFERTEFNVQDSLRRRFFNWVEGLIDWLFPNRGGGGVPNLGFYALLAWAVAIIGAVVLLFFFGYWLRSLLASFVLGSDGRAQAQGGDAASVRAVDARAEATAYAQAGNYREAVRQLYLSALLSMEENGVIRYDRSLTNREVLAQVNRRRAASASDAAGDASAVGAAHGEKVEHEQVGEHLKPVVETFDSVWYGVREPNAETFSSYEEEIGDLNQAMGQTEKKTEKRQVAK